MLDDIEEEIIFEKIISDQIENKVFLA